MQNFSLARFVRVYALLSIAILASPCLAQSEQTTRSITHGEWRVAIVRGESDVRGGFFARIVHPIAGSHSAFYCARSGDTWTTYAYPGPSIGAAALRAETQFQLRGALLNDPYIRRQVASSADSDPSQPLVQYSQLTNALVEVLHLLGVFQSDSIFPVAFVGDIGASSLGVFSRASLGARCPVIAASGLPTTIDCVSVFLNELLADTDGQKTYELVDSELRATSGPMFALMGGIIDDCFWSIQFCTPWSAWAPSGPWVLDSYTPLSFGVGANCYYAQNSSRTRTCTSASAFCCLVWNNTWTETQTKQDTDFCPTSGTCGACPPAPPCSL